jgi:triphosphoribosyl-dephospho-CoA synthase
MNPKPIQDAFLSACRAELDALKPGNVHRFRTGHGMDVAHFEQAAEAAAPHIAAPGAPVGQRIEAAVRASFSVTGLNTNLGIVLLCAPLAVAAEQGGALRLRLAEVLDRLTLEDTDAVYRAILFASPAGLGRAEEHDVADPARVTLREAMRAAAHRDLIAAQYANTYADIFGLGLSRLKGVTPTAQAEAVHMAFLATFPDSHIARKFGLETAEKVRLETIDVAAAIDWQAPDNERRAPLDAFDRSLKERGLNPGTTADLTVATLFAAKLGA